eukprot:3720289-Pleurochrysis_carterae.AAC.2
MAAVDPMIYFLNTTPTSLMTRSKAVRGPTRSLRPYLLEPRTPELAWRPSGPGGKSLYYIQYSQVRSGSGRGWAGLTHLQVAPGWWRGQAVSAMRATGSHKSRSGARALRKYACGASAK